MIALVKDISLVREYEYKVQVLKTKSIYSGYTLCKMPDKEYKKQIVKGNAINARPMEWFLKIILLSVLPEHIDDLTPEQYEEIENELLKH